MYRILRVYNNTAPGNSHLESSVIVSSDNLSEAQANSMLYNEFNQPDVSAVFMYKKVSGEWRLVNKITE